MSKATETMKVYLDAIQALDIDKVVDMFADDVSQGVPFAPEGTPDMIEGKEAVSANFRGLPMMFKKLAYSDVEIVETTDPDFAVGFAKTDAGKGFMHESFHKDDPTNYTRDWFAWQNTLFGELICKLVAEGKLDLLNSITIQ